MADCRIYISYLYYIPELLGGGLLFLLCRIAGKTYAEFLEYLMVDLAEHHSRVYLTTVEFREFFKRATAILVIGAQHRESHEHFVGV